jgi:hypothetical protein
MGCSDSEETIYTGPGTLAFGLPLFDDYFGYLQFKYGRESSLQEDEWESESQEPLYNGNSCFEQVVLCAFTRTFDPLSANLKIIQVVVLAIPRERHKKSPNQTYRQALLSDALITDTSVSATSSVSFSQKGV